MGQSSRFFGSVRSSGASKNAPKEQVTCSVSSFKRCSCASPQRQEWVCERRASLTERCDVGGAGADECALLVGVPPEVRREVSNDDHVVLGDEPSDPRRERGCVLGKVEFGELCVRVRVLYRVHVLDVAQQFLLLTRQPVPGRDRTLT